MKKRLIDGNKVTALVALTLAGMAVFFIVFDLVLATLSRAG